MDQLYVVNQALAHLGQASTETVDPAAAREVVRKVLAHADAARDAALEAAPWLDATAYATLSAAAGDNGNWRWKYRYDLPGDALRIVTVNPDDPAFAWERGTFKDPDTLAERTVIWANDAGPLDVAYTWRIAWTSLSTALADAMGLELAARACFAVTGDRAQAVDLRTAADQAMMRARGADAVQQGGEDPPVWGSYARLRLC